MAQNVVRQLEGSIWTAAVAAQETPWGRWIVTLFVTVLGALGTVAFWDEIEATVQRSLDVRVTGALKNEQLSVETGRLAREIVRQLLTDKETQRVATAFVQGVVDDKGTRDKVAVLVSDVLAQRAVRRSIQDLLADPQTALSLQYLMQWAASDPAVQKSVLSLVEWLAVQPEMAAAVAHMGGHAVQDPWLVEEAGRGLSQAAADAARSEQLQQAVADGLWAVLARAVGLSTSDLRGQCEPAAESAAQGGGGAAGVTGQEGESEREGAAVSDVSEAGAARRPQDA